MNQSPTLPKWTPWRIALLAVILGVFFWSYWPAVLFVVRAWWSQPDYSHGFLVLPIAVYMLYYRRGTMPPLSVSPGWTGLLILAAVLLLRFGAAWMSIDAANAWTMVFWVAGSVWLFAGWRFFWWALPAIAFLGFAIPLPFRLETAVSYQLQSIATAISTWILQLLGQPALASSNIILLGDHRLEVAQACSGLRIFVSMAAVAYAMAVFETSWVKRLIYALAVIPVSLLANGTRIVLTGLLYQLWSSKAAQVFSHDLAGVVMIPFAALLYFLLLAYCSRLVSVQKEATLGDFVRNPA